MNLPTQDPCQDRDAGLELYAASQSCVYNFPGTLRISPGQCHPHVLLARAMLMALGREFPELQTRSAADELDRDAESDLRRLQKLSLLEETGCLDKRTWNRLTRLYRALFDRHHAPSQG